MDWILGVAFAAGVLGMCALVLHNENEAAGRCPRCGSDLRSGESDLEAWGLAASGAPSVRCPTCGTVDPRLSPLQESDSPRGTLAC